ncbi:flavodoxin reductase (ferredoxin-NADPH reductase) family 1 [Microbacterium testaceum StLB037]|uniref:Flavodoxin reductase (Ferredoxin-NADPH reductase) family 1 n=1 Tax=Microbacterium testaceum (strain StLB037) TaxID=979556 RepID=E8NAQ6_MICTS|nr:FAD-dependent oxidoreductase [Microbacterium testaceum]BAJ75923.1 flavodoxin reductase (ferredoxin-NADPH reductase) family 1 [Microbacterium testaceum StLB037]
MSATLTAGSTRVLGLIGRVSMYRLVMSSLGLLALYALVLSFAGQIGPQPLEIVASAVVLAVACGATDLIAQSLLRMPRRLESSLITAAILLFVLRPTVEPLGLAGLALAGVAASASKYLLAWRGRHIFNPAATGAAVVTIVSIWAPDLGGSAWWVGSPWMAGPVLVLGVLLLLRTDKLPIVVTFWLVGMAVAFLRTTIQFQSAGFPVDVPAVLLQVAFSSPFLFLGAFMLSEPLTLPPRRVQQYAVAVVVGVLAGWPIAVGAITLGQERALLIGNLVAFLFCLRAAVRLRVEGRRDLTPTVRELTFHAARPFAFSPGQYLELDVPHRRPDARGTRREFSIVSAPEDLPEVRIAFKDGSQSSYKKALAAVEPGSTLAVTGVWGDFILPARPTAPVLLVAAGIGVTPFVSQLRHLMATGQRRDAVLVYVVSEPGELAFRDEIAASGIPVIVFSRDEPRDLPEGWTWAGPDRVDAEGLLRAVPDIAQRAAYVSGPPRLISALAPALAKAKSLTTDAFAGY